MSVAAIIIRDTKIQVQAAKTSAEKIAAVSAGATKLVCQLQLTAGDHLSDEDLKAISEVQSHLLAGMFMVTKADVEKSVLELFECFNELEKKVLAVDMEFG